MNFSLTNLLDLNPLTRSRSSPYVLATLVAGPYRLRIVAAEGFVGALINDVSKFLQTSWASIIHHIVNLELEYWQLSEPTYRQLETDGIATGKRWQRALLPIETVIDIARKSRGKHAKEVFESIKKQIAIMTSDQGNHLLAEA